jgi:hypothetical protein
VAARLLTTRGENQRSDLLAEVRVDEKYWASIMLPEGLIERWLVTDGAKVRAGEAIVAVRIEDTLHNIQSPIDGRLTISALPNYVVEPGSVVGQVDPQ